MILFIYSWVITLYSTPVHGDNVALTGYLIFRRDRRRLESEHHTSIVIVWLVYNNARFGVRTKQYVHICSRPVKYRFSESPRKLIVCNVLLRSSNPITCHLFPFSLPPKNITSNTSAFGTTVRKWSALLIRSDLILELLVGLRIFIETPSINGLHICLIYDDAVSLRCLSRIYISFVVN